MKSFILFMWQAPQNILGMLVVLFSIASKTNKGYYISAEAEFGVSLGDFIIFGKYHPRQVDLAHERGHQKQSLYLGPLYLLLIGVPSILGNLWDMLLHRKWTPEKREKWYYSLIWEAWADRLGYVRRFTKGD